MVAPFFVAIGLFSTLYQYILILEVDLPGLFTGITVGKCAYKNKRREQ